MKVSKLDKLREDLHKLQKERAKIQLEKGLAAEENKDLRENADYDYWFQKEIHITQRIGKLIEEIEQLHKNKNNK